VTFPLRADLSTDTVKTLRRLLDQAFWEADRSPIPDISGVCRDCGPEAC
jgi:hypothetical protein